MYKVIIVEDNPMVASIIQQYLQTNMLLQAGENKSFAADNYRGNKTEIAEVGHFSQAKPSVKPFASDYCLLVL